MTTFVPFETARTWHPSAGVSDEDLTEALGAACDYVAGRARWGAVASDGSPMQPPAAIVQAVKLLVARYLARRNSADGIVGMSELGPMRITSVDRDVEALIQPFRPAVFG